MARGLAAFAEVSGDLRQWKRNCKTYRQTGITDEGLSAGFREAGRKLATLAPFASWQACKHHVAKITTMCCQGSKQEAFSARQVAADVFRVKGCVVGGGPAESPENCRLGPGAKAGWFLAQRAAGMLASNIRTPGTVPQCMFPGKQDNARRTWLCVRACACAQMLGRTCARRLKACHPALIRARTFVHALL